MQTLAAAPPLDPELDDDIEVGIALLDDMELLAMLDEEADELSWAIAPLAAKAARRATGMMLNFILRVVSEGPTISVTATRDEESGRDGLKRKERKRKGRAEIGVGKGRIQKSGGRG